jgi:hypothetical protein
MEFVDSRPIDRWCDEGKLNVTQRLQLFRSACDAVQYAHQRLIVRGFLLRKTLRRSTEEIEHRIMRHRGFLVSLRDTRPEPYPSLGRGGDLRVDALRQRHNEPTPQDLV